MKQSGKLSFTNDKADFLSTSNHAYQTLIIRITTFVVVAIFVHKGLVYIYMRFMSGMKCIKSNILITYIKHVLLFITVFFVTVYCIPSQ